MIALDHRQRYHTGELVNRQNRLISNESKVGWLIIDSPRNNNNDTTTTTTNNNNNKKKKMKKTCNMSVANALPAN